MQPWFIFKNRNSYSEGLWISKLPEIVRAAERYTTVTIPGRAGKLTMLEGEDICDDYIKECVVTCPTEMDADLAAFFKVMKENGWDGRISFEGGAGTLPKEEFVANLKKLPELLGL